MQRQREKVRKVIKVTTNREARRRDEEGIDLTLERTASAATVETFRFMSSRIQITASFACDSESRFITSSDRTERVFCLYKFPSKNSSDQAISCESPSENQQTN
ncbi:hypothetical protein WR25_01910 [Diploscapter pachys]|uniref:Uncharacterized protein n=1 Tax=Diploscapter pachys TaxID=2018661 RepID=A0A2A2L4B9_9BILA|nr:hypothetical protein WR25_01910 [Diploscapter pachys]